MDIKSIIFNTTDIAKDYFFIVLKSEPIFYR